MAAADPVLLPLPPQAEGIDWPTRDWMVALHAAIARPDRLNALLDEAFADPAPDVMGETHAFLAVQRGMIVAERYWKGFGPDDTYKSWSMAKSITHALIGILVRDGLIDIHAPADVPEWQGAGDPRGGITLDQLLRMSSGLEFAEDYVDAGVSHVIEMLFGAGQGDTAAYAAAKPLAHPRDTVWNYSSGTTNIVARCAARAIGKTGEDFHAFMRRELFASIGITSDMPKFDDAGTFIGSSFCFCTARDFARFGLLYLRDGVWDGQRILPEGWVEYARTPTPTPPDEPMGYGAHWWLGLAGEGTFSANGYEGQFIVLDPVHDLILVRHGSSIGEKSDEVRAWLAQVAACFRG